MQAIIFDLDGVIVQTENLHRQAFNDLLKQFDISISEEEWMEKHLGRGSAYLFDMIFRENDIEEDISSWVEKKKQHYSEILKEQPVPITLGIVQFIDMLKQNSIPFIIASAGFHRSVEETLARAGLGNICEIVCVEDVNHRKPNPEVYLVATKKLGKDPVDCVAIEDSVVGVKAAKAAGMKCIALLTTIGKTEQGKEKLADAGADLFAKDFTELSLEILKEL